MENTGVLRRKGVEQHGEVGGGGGGGNETEEVKWIEWGRKSG